MTVYNRPPRLYTQHLAARTGICDVCGKQRGGFSKHKHTKCAKIRQNRGFEQGRDPRQEEPDDQLPLYGDENP